MTIENIGWRVVITFLIIKWRRAFWSLNFSLSAPLRPAEAHVEGVDLNADPAIQNFGDTALCLDNREIIRSQLKNPRVGLNFTFYILNPSFFRVKI